MRSNSKICWILVALFILASGIIPFSSSVGGGGVVPAKGDDADSAPFSRSEIRDVLRVFADAEERRLGNDKEIKSLLQGILDEMKKQTQAIEESRDAMMLVAQRNGKIYEGLVAAGAFPSPPNTQGGVVMSSGGQALPPSVSIKLDPSDLTERYKAVQLDNHRIAIGDTFGNEFLWQYDPAKDKLELLYLLYKDRGTAGLVVCDLDKEVGYVQVPDGIGIATPKFPVPHIHKSP